MIVFVVTAQKKKKKFKILLLVFLSIPAQKMGGFEDCYLCNLGNSARGKFYWILVLTLPGHSLSLVLSLYLG